MAANSDIQLIFGVAGGGSISGKSGELIKSQISSIVGEINRNPLKIKFEADPDSLNRMRESVREVAESISGGVARGMPEIKIDLGLGKNSFNTIAQYGSSARAGIKELKAQAAELEQAFLKTSKASSGMEAVIQLAAKTRQLTPEAFDLFSKLGDNKASLKVQLEAYREYISLMEKLAASQGIDISGITSGFSKSANEIVEGVEKIQSGGQDATSAIEQLKSVFGSSIDSEMLSGKLESIEGHLSGIITKLETIITELPNITAAVKVVDTAAASVEKLDVSTTSMQNVADGIEQVAQSARGLETTGGAAQELAAGMERAAQGAGNAKKEIIAEEQQLKKIADAVRQGRSLLDNNMEAGDKTSFQKLSSELAPLESVLEACGGDASKLSAELKNAGIDGEVAVSRVTTATATLKNELQSAGDKGTVSLRQIIDIATSIQTLLNKNPEAAGTKEFSDLTVRVASLNNVIDDCKNGTLTLEEALHKAGLSGSSVIDDARLAMAEFKNELAKTNAAAGNVADTPGKKIGDSNIANAKKEVGSLIRDIETLKTTYSSSDATMAFEGDQRKVADVLDILSTRVRVYNGELVEEQDMQRAFGETFERTSANILTADTELRTHDRTIKGFKLDLDAAKDSLKANSDQAKQNAKADREALRDSNALSKAIVATNRLYKQATDAVLKYTAAKNGKSSQQYKLLEQEAENLRLLNEQLNNGTISQKQYIEAADKSKSVIQQATAVIKANGEAHLSLGDKIKVAIERFSQYFSLGKIYNAVWRATRQMVQATIELDDAFTQLKIVTSATDSEMEQFAETAIGLSKSLGQSVAGVTKSIETFSRLGYNLPDASALAEYATILANTAAVSTDEATTGLTSIIKGYNLNVEDAEHVSDVLIEVGQKYAVSAGELMEAFERSGAALNATNVSFEKSAGLIAAANAAVQDSSTVGTALKTIAARIRGSKSDLEELGEDTSDLAEGFSKYAAELQALTGFNIMVEGSTTEFKDLYDIMDGVAQVWDRLSDTQQARTSEILGGVRQLQVVSSILGNWQDASGAYAAAMDSAGVASEANDIWMESATAHINQFKVSFEELSKDILSSKLIGGIVDFGSTVLGAIDSLSKFADKLGTIPALATAVAAALSFKNVGELINQFQFPIILRIEYAHEAFN